MMILKTYISSQRNKGNGSLSERLEEDTDTEGDRELTRMKAALITMQSTTPNMRKIKKKREERGTIVGIKEEIKVTESDESQLRLFSIQERDQEANIWD